MSVARRINRRFIYFFLGVTSFVIGLVLMPFSLNRNGSSLGEHNSTANAETPDSPTPDSPTPDSPTPDGPCPTPDPTPCPDAV